jgi:hypothetical protein
MDFSRHHIRILTARCPLTTTVAGRGYGFVAPIISDQAEPDVPETGIAVFRGAALLPARLVRMVGRNEMLTISAELTTWRFVTIVGSGGVGKTTLAVAVALHQLVIHHHFYWLRMPRRPF